MIRLHRDRYCAYDEVHGCDLATGDAVRLSDLPNDDLPDIDPALAPLVEVLEDGRDGEPRWVAADSGHGAQTTAAIRRAAAHAQRCGFVPILVDLYERFADRLAGELADRALLLIAHASCDLADARGALMHAAASSRKPHVLLTFRGAPGAGCVVREARATYGVAHGGRRPPAAPLPADVARHLERAQRAREFQAAGRHAAAERLLRDVAGALTRRDAPAAAASVLVRLGRLLLERGRAVDAEAACGEAVRLADAGHDGRGATVARLWQVAARTDAGKLPDAESLCRAVLLAGDLSPGQACWGRALLARTLRWQKRCDEGLRVEPPPDEHELDEATSAFVRATIVRSHLESENAFEAGQQARTAVERAATGTDPLACVIAESAHLRVVSAMGDLSLARAALERALEWAAVARAPLRDVRARLVWHDALRRAGDQAGADAERRRLERVRAAAPPLLQRAIDDRLQPGPARERRRTPGSALSLVRAIQEETSDLDALRRVVDQIQRDLDASRVDLVSASAGPVSTLLTAGTGLATHIGSRVLDLGLTLPAEVEQGGREIGVPIRFASRVLAAIVCRWPLDRAPHPAAIDTMELAAVVAAPRMDAHLADAREAARASISVPELVGASRAMADVRRAIGRAATAPFSVVIEGESGAGKELVARAIHQLGPRRERRFCDINCAALPDDLLESELFGHTRGAFTGAVADRPGLFEDANGGTLFLDELPDLSPRGQAKLLRVLQQREVRRIGETFSRPIDVRLVTATNRDMHAEVAEGRFRRDLLYRLEVIRIQLPPLRDRPEDIPALAEHFWAEAARSVGSTATLSHGVFAALARYHWPGNVRELQNVIAALAVAAPSRGAVRASLLPAAIAGAVPPASRRLAEARASFERRCIEVALARAGGNRTRAAAELGLSRQGLLKTMARLGVNAAAPLD